MNVAIGASDRNTEQNVSLLVVNVLRLVVPENRLNDVIAALNIFLVSGSDERLRTELLAERNLARFTDHRPPELLESITRLLREFGITQIVPV